MVEKAEPPGLLSQLKDEAKHDARAHLRSGSAVDPDDAALDVLFRAALERLTLRLGIADRAMPGVLIERLRADYKREFSRRIGNETGRWPIPKMVN